MGCNLKKMLKYFCSTGLKAKIQENFALEREQEGSIYHGFKILKLSSCHFLSLLDIESTFQLIPKGHILNMNRFCTLQGTPG